VLLLCHGAFPTIFWILILCISHDFLDLEFASRGVSTVNHLCHIRCRFSIFSDEENDFRVETEF